MWFKGRLSKVTRVELVVIKVKLVFPVYAPVLTSFAIFVNVMIHEKGQRMKRICFSLMTWDFPIKRSAA